MTGTRTVHTVLLSGHPDGRQYVACACPVGADHPPAARIEPVEDQPGLWWVEYSTLGPDWMTSDDDDE